MQEALGWLRATTGEFAAFDELTRLAPSDLVFEHIDLAKGLHRALRRAKKAHLVHLQMTVDLSDADAGLRETMQSSGWTCPDLQCDKLAMEQYACPDCNAAFKGEAHLATHRQRVHGTLVASRRFVVSTKCPACRKNFHTRPRAIKHLQYQSTRCLPWLLIHGEPISADLARTLDDVDAAKIGTERRSGIRSAASRMPVDDSEAVVPERVNFVNTAQVVPVELRGYSPVSRARLDFVSHWTNIEVGPWTLDDEAWQAFAIALQAAFLNCPAEELESFKGVSVIWWNKSHGARMTSSWCDRPRTSCTKWRSITELSNLADCLHLTYLEKDFGSSKLSWAPCQLGWACVIILSGMLRREELLTTQWYSWRRQRGSGGQKSQSGGRRSTAPSVLSIVNATILSSTVGTGEKET